MMKINNRILVVSRIPTHPTIAANQWWIMANCEALSKIGCDVHLLYVHEKPFRQKEAIDSIDLTKKYWKDKFHLYRVSFFEKLFIALKTHIHGIFNNGYIKCDDWYPSFLHYYVRRLNKRFNFDTCVVQYFYLTKLFEYISIPKKALVTHDNFAYRDIVVGQRTSCCLDANETAKAMQRSPYIFAFNKNDEVFFSLLSPKSKVYTIYSIFEFHAQPIVGNHNIVFLSGSNQWNQNGLNWFLSRIFPTIINSFPECKLILGGAICEKFKHLEGNKNVILYGFVDDIYSFYSQADICINPTYQGTGFKTKTFEALSYDKVELAHPHSSIGIFKQDEAPIFFSEKADEWLEELKELWADKCLIQDIKNRNANYIRAFHDYVIGIYTEFLND